MGVRDVVVGGREAGSTMVGVGAGFMLGVANDNDSDSDVWGVSWRRLRGDSRGVRRRGPRAGVRDLLRLFVAVARR